MDDRELSSTGAAGRPSGVGEGVPARLNPFRSERIEGLAFDAADVAEAAWDLAGPNADADAGDVDRLLAAGARGAIVGPEGTGKTTLLLHWARGLRERGLAVRVCFLNDRSPPPTRGKLDRLIAALNAGEYVLYDGAGWLPRASLRRLARARPEDARLIVTAHDDAELDGAGRGPFRRLTRGAAVAGPRTRRDPLPVLIRTGSSASLLRRLVARLGVELSDPQAQALRRRHDGNIRLAFRELYDLAAAGRADPGVSDDASGSPQTSAERGSLH